jgi:hypothetical protein
MGERPATIPPVTTTATQLHHVKTLARQRRVNRQLAAWDLLDPDVEIPMLDREQLKSLQVALLACPGELEARYARG